MTCGPEGRQDYADDPTVSIDWPKRGGARDADSLAGLSGGALTDGIDCPVFILITIIRTIFGDSIGSGDDALEPVRP